MEMKLCHMLVGKYLVSPGGAHGQHHAGGVRGAAVQGREVRLPNFNPNYFLISILTKNVQVLEDDYK